MPFKEREVGDPGWWPCQSEWSENKTLRMGGKSVPDLYCKKCHGAGWVHTAKADGTADYRQVMRCRCVVSNAKYNG